VRRSAPDVISRDELADHLRRKSELDSLRERLYALLEEWDERQAELIARLGPEPARPATIVSIRSGAHGPLAGQSGTT